MSKLRAPGVHIYRAPFAGPPGHRDADLDGYTRLERAYLNRRVCGFCEIGLLSSHCGMMFPLPGEAGCDESVRRTRRAMALEDYRPRTPRKR